jgi:hypothetical protein
MAAAVLGGIGLLAGACASCSAGRAPATAPGGGAATGGGAAAGARRQAAAVYLAIAVAGNRRLETDFDGLSGRDRNNLGRARADLRDAAATERLFDRRLLAIALPAAAERAARILFQMNESRAALTSEAAAVRTLAQLHAYAGRLSAANEPVELAVRIIRSELGLPPPGTS